MKTIHGGGNTWPKFGDIKVASGRPGVSVTHTNTWKRVHAQAITVIIVANQEFL